MKLAIMLAGVASGNKLAGDPTRILQQGAKVMRSNPQLSALGDQVRDQLVDAGKGVAVAALSRQMESLSQRLAAPADRVGSAAPSPHRRGTAGGEDDGPRDDTANDTVDDTADDARGEERDETPPRRRREAQGRTGAKRSPAPASGSGSGSAKKKSTATKGGGGMKAGASSPARSATSGSRARRDAPAPQARRGERDG